MDYVLSHAFGNLLYFSSLFDLEEYCQLNLEVKETLQKEPGLVFHDGFLKSCMNLGK